MFLWLTFHQSGLELQELALTGQQWLFFVAAVVTIIFATWVQSIRAKLLWVNQEKKLYDIYTFKSLLIGNFYNCVLPGNLGEGVRAWHFSKKNHVRFSKSLAAVFAEKWIDAQLYVLCVVILFAIKPFTSHYISYAIAYTALVALGLSIIYNLMGRYRRLQKIIGLMALWFKKPGKFFFKLYWHTTVLVKNISQQGLTLHYILLCATVLFLNIIQFFLLLKCAGIEEPVASMYTAYLTCLSMMIIAFIPSAPSSIGVLHYGIYSVAILAASQYHLKPNSLNLQSYALYAVYLHLSYVLPEVILGGLVVLAERKTLFHK